MSTEDTDRLAWYHMFGTDEPSTYSIDNSIFAPLTRAVVPAAEEELPLPYDIDLPPW